MKNESTYRIAVIVLLAGILAVQSAVLIRTNKVSDVYVKNPDLGVNVKNAIKLDPLAFTPTFDVNVEGQPIQVEIVR
ncbi:MAG: hypothetical protein ABSD57_10300 [Verrucomicrobiota bacterium]|jgi:LPS O-antigen subunit length determinant protein (WzzB/FepE family)